MTDNSWGTTWLWACLRSRERDGWSWDGPPTLWAPPQWCRLDHYTIPHCKGRRGVSLELQQGGQATVLGSGSAACPLGQSGSNTQVGEDSVPGPFSMPCSEAAVTQHLPAPAAALAKLSLSRTHSLSLVLSFSLSRCLVMRTIPNPLTSGPYY